MQIKSLIYLQYPLHVLTYDVVSLLPFLTLCVIMHLLLLWWSRIKRMNDLEHFLKHLLPGGGG